jgi:hypothetical protein
MLFVPVRQSEAASVDCVIDVPIMAESSTSIAVSKQLPLLGPAEMHHRLRISQRVIGRSPILPYVS